MTSRLVEVFCGIRFVDDIRPMQNLVVSNNLGRSSIRRDGMVLGQDQNPRGDFPDQREFVCCGDDGFASLFQFADQVYEPMTGAQIESVGRLIQQQDLWIHG